MIRDVILPQLAMGMSEGTIVEWSVTEGARVVRDQTLLTIETEKVVTDLPAPYTGFVHTLAAPGQTLSVETVIGKIADTEEEYLSLTAPAGDQQVQAAHAEPVPDVGNVAQPAGSLVVTAAPASPSRTPQALSGTKRIRASGLAKAVARKNGFDLAQLTGSGPGGRIVRRDVMQAIASGATPVHILPAQRIGTSAALQERTRIPLSGMRAAIAQKMLAAKTVAAQTYMFFEVDITKLSAARKTMLDYEEALGIRISLLSFYVRAIAIACQHVPICNATLQDNEITVWDTVNVGIAVALAGSTEYESGLIVPVVHNVHGKGVHQIAREIKDLAGKARASRLTPADTGDGTITISSSQDFFPGGWMVSTPLLNLPQVINFQPGTPIKKPVVIDGKVVIREMLPCGLTFDHRAMDGQPAGRFAAKLGELLANPELMLL